MLISFVVLPDAFSVEHLSKPQYRDNMQILLEGIQTNGLILIDQEGLLLNKLHDKITSLINNSKSQKIVIYFEELMKMERRKIKRFIKTDISSASFFDLSEIAASIARNCKAYSLLTDPQNCQRLVETIDGELQVIPIDSYISSDVEAKRRKYLARLPPLDQMESCQFDKLIIDATRFSRWLRFYDKQIGKGGNLDLFRHGIEKILELWVKNAYFRRSELSVQLFTVADESRNRRLDPGVAYKNVKHDIVDYLVGKFDLRIDFHVKLDPNSYCHARYLQTQSFAILFERGFDFLKRNGDFKSTFITIACDSSGYLDEFRKLSEFVPDRSQK